MLYFSFALALTRSSFAWAKRGSMEMKGEVCKLEESCKEYGVAS